MEVQLVHKCGHAFEVPAGMRVEQFAPSRIKYTDCDACRAAEYERDNARAKRQAELRAARAAAVAAPVVKAAPRVVGGQHVCRSCDGPLSGYSPRGLCDECEAAR